MYRQLQIVPGKEGFLVRNEDQDIALFKTHKDAELFINNMLSSDQMLPPQGILPYEPMLNPNMVPNKYFNPAFMGPHFMNDYAPAKEKVEKEIITQPVSVPQYIPTPTPQVIFIQQPPVTPAYPPQYPPFEQKKETKDESCECHTRKHKHRHYVHNHGCESYNYPNIHDDYHYNQYQNQRLNNRVVNQNQFNPNMNPYNNYNEPMMNNQMNNNYAQTQYNVPYPQYNNAQMHNYAQAQNINENIVSNNLNQNRYMTNQVINKPQAEFDYNNYQPQQNFNRPIKENIKYNNPVNHQEEIYSDYHQYNNGNIVEEETFVAPPKQVIREQPKYEPQVVPKMKVEHPRKEVVNSHIQNTPVEVEPIKTVPIETEPVQNTLIENEPIKATQIESTPVQSAPIENEPIKATLSESVPEQSAIVETTKEQVTTIEQEIEINEVKEINKIDFQQLDEKKDSEPKTDLKAPTNDTNIWINTELENTTQFNSVNELDDLIAASDEVTDNEINFEEEDTYDESDNEFVLGSGFGGDESMNLDLILNGPASSYEELVEKMKSKDLDRREKKILKRQLKELKDLKR